MSATIVDAQRDAEAIIQLRQDLIAARHDIDAQRRAMERLVQERDYYRTAHANLLHDLTRLLHAQKGARELREEVPYAG